jgi:hypothetical protein
MQRGKSEIIQGLKAQPPMPTENAQAMVLLVTLEVLIDIRDQLRRLTEQVAVK